MKYFFDTEFIEGWHKPLLGKRRHFIDLISIGIVSEDGNRMYYAVSNEFNPAMANDFVRKEVLPHLPEKHFNGTNIEDVKLWKSNEQIAQEIYQFINPDIKDLVYKITRADEWSERFYPDEFKYIRDHNTRTPDSIFKSGSGGYERNGREIYNQPEFYAYYADYDWVVFCSLFGRMVDLPKGFPKYCLDLKQMMHDRGLTKQWTDHNCPKGNNEHHALADAIWNRKLYEKIIQSDSVLTHSK